MQWRSQGVGGGGLRGLITPWRICRGLIDCGQSRDGSAKEYTNKKSRDFQSYVEREGERMTVTCEGGREREKQIEGVRAGDRREKSMVDLHKCGPALLPLVTRSLGH